MLSYTHIVMGVSASLALLDPNNKAQSLVVIGAASVGSITSDLDVRINTYSIDAFYGRIMVMAILALVALIDMKQRLGIYNYYMNLKGPMLYRGVCGFALVILGCIFSSHRGFSHSFLALGLSTLSLVLIDQLLALAFAIAFFSHLLLDFLNKGKIKLLFPAKAGFCLNLFYSSKIANKIFFVIGCVILVKLLLIYL